MQDTVKLPAESPISGEGGWDRINSQRKEEGRRMKLPTMRSLEYKENLEYFTVTKSNVRHDNQPHDESSSLNYTTLKLLTS
ncbi:hypothetical protein HZH66_012521 [Vespula vulgaris]|uniref:Uncharacterized protein n=1 Tax=Vespula vulgaris TaxID=7454 RepID=A0A834JEQ1_VESVU|nr:hypothetical protein HZH66_012521 [Vespula vulgaris]